MTKMDYVLFVLGYLVASSRLLLCFTPIPAKNSNLCGDWINYKNEKCFKVVDEFGPQTNKVAETICRSYGLEFTKKPLPRLITIKNKEQQEFLLHHLHVNNKMAANIWLGVTQNNKNGQLEWNDGSKLEFSNLVDLNMNDSNSQCVAMNLNEAGLWLRMNCRNQNIIVCERDVKWSLANLEGFQQDSNQSEVERNDVKSEQDCKEKIVECEHNTSFLKDAAEKAIEVLKEATEKVTVQGTRVTPIKEISVVSSALKQSSLCGDWESYNDEKCVKIVDKLKRWEDAVIECSKLSDESQPGTSADLLTIKNKEEQEAFSSFLFVKKEIVDNVWLGLKKESDGLFKWTDGTELAFNNWANQTLSDNQSECTEIKSGEGFAAAGLWFRVSCKRKNLVVCEKRPNWTIETLTNAFLKFKMGQKMDKKQLIQKQEEVKKELEQKQEELKQQVKQIQAELKQEVEQKQVEMNREVEQKQDQSKKEAEQKRAELKQDLEQKQAEMKTKFEEQQRSIKTMIDSLDFPVPIGFIYVQLPEQASPFSLWPETNWTDVSTSYAGLFFRVVGGQAAPFGHIQEANSSKLEEVAFDRGYDLSRIIVPPDGEWSKRVQTAYSGGNYLYGLKFRLSTSEVRPRNQAVKVWKRIS